MGDHPQSNQNSSETYTQRHRQLYQQQTKTHGQAPIVHNKIAHSVAKPKAASRVQFFSSPDAKQHKNYILNENFL